MVGSLKMPPGAYVAAPITEAVIDLQIETPLGQGDLQKLKTRFAREYPNSEEAIDWNFGFEVGPGGKVTTHANETARWYKLTSNDQTDILLVKPMNITTSRTSPYRGWDQLFEAARRNYGTHRRVVGYKKVVRIATRYINRIDIPISELNERGLDSYFRVRPGFPADRSTQQFLLQSVLEIPEVSAKANFFFGSVPSPLLDHASFILDVDLYRDHDIPAREEELWEMVRQFRPIKNRLFEDSVTDHARDLFDAA